MMTELEKLQAEFDMFATRAAIVIPPERREALFQGFCDLRRMVARLHGARTAQTETAHVFSIEHVRRDDRTSAADGK